MGCKPNLETKLGLLKTVSIGFSGFGALLLASAAFSSEAIAETAIAYRAAPNITSSDIDRSDGPNVFDTVAVPIRAKPTSTRWTKIMKASLDQPALVRLTEGAKELPPLEQAAYVQSIMSYAVRNRSSAIHCSDDGYWAAASETLVRGMGDCIDIAVAKMEALRLLGIPKENFYLTTGYVSQGNGRGKIRESAALLVRIGESFWLLPERANRIVLANGRESASSKFTPILTYGVGKTWLHGRLVKTAMLGN